MTELEELEELEAKLAKLRAMGERIEQQHLEVDDWPVLAALFSELIDQAEPGQEEVVIELREDVPAYSDTKTGNAANSARMTSEEDGAKRGAHGGARPFDSRR